MSEKRLKRNKIIFVMKNRFCDTYMATSKWSNDEKLITKAFDNESEDYFKGYEKKSIPKTAEVQIDSIIEAKSSTVIDVGSGPGVIMIKMLDQGVQHVTGIDLSPKMIEIAQKEIEKKNLVAKTELIEGSFLEIVPKKVDAIFLHRVLCCHPDREVMIDKSVSHDPNIITFTSLRDWKLLRGGLVVVKGIRKLIRGKFFLPFVPRFSEIDEQLKKEGYYPITTYKSKLWITKTYKKDLK
ncbi:MAG: tRNA (cmo5U34)-methyltransferase [Candidatus Heimdallarchaeota archaeon LC_3]|nr:MAG: tRNA (cmo5U34)-methyltransferase [Candidatus Heimdallarchaeota archaeon LC_3]